MCRFRIENHGIPDEPDWWVYDDDNNGVVLATFYESKKDAELFVAVKMLVDALSSPPQP